MASKQEVLAAIASGEIFTDAYQSREIQIKIDKMCDRLNQKKSAEPHKVNNINSADTEFNPYAGKKSGDYVGD